jgi:hypothetical protein
MAISGKGEGRRRARPRICGQGYKAFPRVPRARGRLDRPIIGALLTSNVEAEVIFLAGTRGQPLTPGDVLIGWNEGGRRRVGRRHPRDRDVSGVVNGEARSERGVHPW